MYNGYTESPEQIEARKQRILKGYRNPRPAKLGRLPAIARIVNSLSNGAAIWLLVQSWIGRHP